MSTDDISVDSDIAFAFVDFSNVDFGGSVEGEKYDSAKTSGGGHDVDRLIAAEKAPVRKASILKQQAFPGGQEPEEDHVYDPELFEAQCRRLQNLVKWYELGIRPSKDNRDVHVGKDEDLFQASNDDLKQLLLRTMEAQDELNKNLPPHPNTNTDHEKNLRVATSSIENAGNGLFTTTFIPRGTVVCHYTGYRHHYQSQKRLKNRAYVLKLQNGWPKHARMNDGFVDAFPCKSVLARFINDPRIEEKCNVKFEHIQEPGTWHCPVVAQRDIEAGEELFISYGPRYWAGSRMIGGDPPNFYHLEVSLTMTDFDNRFKRLCTLDNVFSAVEAQLLSSVSLNSSFGNINLLLSLLNSRIACCTSWLLRVPFVPVGEMAGHPDQNDGLHLDAAQDNNGERSCDVFDKLSDNRLPCNSKLHMRPGAYHGGASP